MSRYNTSLSPSVGKAVQSVNREEGDTILFEDPRFKFYLAATTNLMEPQFYRTENQFMRELSDHINTCGVEFSVRLAIYTAHNANLRTVPLVIMAIVADKFRGNSLVGKGVTQVIRRADQLAEMIACSTHISNKRPGSIPRQVLNGVGNAFVKFNAYHFAKYQGKGNEISLRDAMFISRPNPGLREQLYRDIANNELKAAITWESAKSSVGIQVAKESEEVKTAASKATWEELIDARKMGYMATIRNVRNMLDDNINMGHIKIVVDFITNRDAIVNSKLLPWRFYAACREIEKGELGWDHEKAELIYNALINASIFSVRNMASFAQCSRTISVADVSGSMKQPFSLRGTVMASELARFYGRMLRHANQGNSYMEFATKLDVNPSTNPFERGLGERNADLGNGTMAYLVLENMIKYKKYCDNLVIFTDNQFWDEKKPGPLEEFTVGSLFAKYLEEYRYLVNDKMKLYLIALCDYNTGAPVSLTGSNFVVSGFDDNTFKSLDALNNSRAIIDEITRMEVA